LREREFHEQRTAEACSSKREEEEAKENFALLAGVEWINMLLLNNFRSISFSSELFSESSGVIFFFLNIFVGIFFRDVPHLKSEFIES
jgi:hypothetical protein